jgi:DNA-binding MarR family transcriptional regulator
MQHEKDEQINAVIQQFKNLMYSLQRTSTTDWQTLDLTMAQLKVVLTLGFEGPIAISKLASALAISHPTASHLVEKVVQAGLAERVEHETDRRSTLARLSPAGEMMFHRLRQGRQSGLQNLLAHLDIQDLAALQQGLDALNRAARFTASQEAAPTETDTQPASL